MDKGLLLNSREIVKIFDFIAIAEEVIQLGKEEKELMSKLYNHLEENNCSSDSIYFKYYK
jgi:hypothetical protein